MSVFTDILRAILNRLLRPVDIQAMLREKAAKNPEQLDWQNSIVDLMKLLNLDSSLASRRRLATELGYTGSITDTASMNMWLHATVMRKLKENGGRVPPDLH